MQNKGDKQNQTLDRATGLRRELASLIAQSIGQRESMETALPGVRLARRTAPTPPCSVTYAPSLTVVAQGRKHVAFGRTAFDYDASHFLLTALDLPAIASVVEASEKHPCLVVSIAIDMPLVRELIARGELPEAPVPNSSPAMAVAATTPELLDACCRLLRLLATPEDIPVLHGLIEREILYRLLRSPEGPRLRAIATQGEQSHRTAKAIAWIRNNFAKPLVMEDLAQVAGMAVSTLHHHFRALTALSPLQYQKQLRLQTARKRMLLDSLDANSAAFEVGYESASQFNREYSRFFGQPPLRDIRTLKAQAGSTRASSPRSRSQTATPSKLPLRA